MCVAYSGIFQLVKTLTSLQLEEQVIKVCIDNTVKSPVSEHPKCKEFTTVAYGRCLLTMRAELQGVFYRQKSGHIYFLERM